MKPIIFSAIVYTSSPETAPIQQCTPNLEAELIILMPLFFLKSIYLSYRAGRSPTCLATGTWLVTPKNFRPIDCFSGNVCMGNRRGNSVMEGDRACASCVIACRALVVQSQRSVADQQAFGCVPRVRLHLREPWARRRQDCVRCRNSRLQRCSKKTPKNPT